MKTQYNIENLPIEHKLNKRRLAKIHKLKRENRVLASERKKLINNEIAQRCEYHYPSAYNTYRYSRRLCRISEQIGRNSAKIMRLRTLIQQSKIVWNNHKAFPIRKSISENHKWNLIFLNILNLRYKDFPKLNLLKIF